MTQDRNAVSLSHSNPAIHGLLQQIAECWEDREKGDLLMNQIIDLGKEDLEVLVSAYRFYFYRSDFEIALEMGRKIERHLEQKLSLPSDPETRRNKLKEDPDHPDVRLYLQTVSAIGFLLARIGQREEAAHVLRAIQGIQPKHSFGSDGVLFFLENPDRDDYADEES